MAVGTNRLRDALEMACQDVGHLQRGQAGQPARFCPRHGGRSVDRSTCPVAEACVGGPAAGFLAVRSLLPSDVVEDHRWSTAVIDHVHLGAKIATVARLAVDETVMLYALSVTIDCTY